jgi:alpha-N-arabinofuranosidase
MANIAQTVNVLQAMILTEGEKMLLTPTYHVFEMFKVHQDAEALALHLEADEYNLGEESIPQISGSASRRTDGTIDISLCNVDPHYEAVVTLWLRGLAGVKKVTGRVLTHADLNAHNTFEQPETVKPQAFDGVTDVSEGGLSATLPPMSIVVLTLA